jgi:hypothetical protein
MSEKSKKIIKKLNGANMDIDLITEKSKILWNQDLCPWNKEANTTEHKCAVKNISICPYFCGIEYLDKVLCSYPHKNPNKNSNF